MELKPHYRVVRFSPTPEIVEPINVALLLVDGPPRLIVDNEFQKLHCVAPRFNQNVLRFLLDSIQDDLRSIDPKVAYEYLASRTGQLQVGKPHQITGSVSDEFVSNLVDTYLKRHSKPHPHSSTHAKYVDSLLDDALLPINFDKSNLIKKARPEDFLSSKSRSILKSERLKFSRVVNGSKGIVLMDGVNMSVTSQPQIKQRSQSIGFAFYVIGQAINALRDIEQKEVTRAAWVFNMPATSDPEVDYCVTQLSRDSDLLLESPKSQAAKLLAGKIQAATGGLLPNQG